MEKVILTVDSGICPKKKEDTIVVPAQLISSSGECFTDNDQEITNAQILERMAQNGEVFKTSSPELGDFDSIFREILEQGKDVVHLSMSSGISQGSVNGAHTVAQILNDEYSNQVYVVDSLTGATGGTMLYEMAYRQLLQEDLSASQLVDGLNELKSRIHTSFYVPDASGFLRSGRDKTASHFADRAISVTSHLVKLSGFKFRVDFDEKGDLYLHHCFRGSSQNGMYSMVKEIVNDQTMDQYDSRLAVIGNLYEDRVDMRRISNYLTSYFDEVIDYPIGSVVAAYGCHDLCGISLVKKI